ncbi:hypothetical protein BJV74DRAFT_814276 [Russula compacta]|nr:hypothetical protein BJV74DRAFT_814276 [Russula compacta]
MTSSYLSTIRLVTFVTAIIFAVIVICLSADLISLTEPAYYFKFSAFALSTGLLTVLTITPMLVIDLFRQGSFFSYVVVEIAWLSVLWVFWLSSGSYAAWRDSQIALFFPEESSCNYGVLTPSVVTQGCQEIKGIMAFSFLSWLLLMTYTVILLTLAIRAHGRGNPAWTTGVGDGPILSPAQKVIATPTQVPFAPATIPQSYSLAPQPALPSSVSYASHASYPVAQV